MKWIGPGVLGLAGGKKIQPGEIVPEGAIDPARAERLEKAGKLEIQKPPRPKAEDKIQVEDKPPKPKRRKKKVR